MSSKVINRITLFKIANEEDRDKALAAYTKLNAEQKKDGKPYILSCRASKLYDDPRSKDFNVCAQTSFASLEDMKYYDSQCEAHKALKVTVTPLMQGVMSVYMDA